MRNLIGPFYALFVLGVVFAGSFVVFHLANYSINRGAARLTILFFVVGTILLVAINAALFFSVPFDQLGTFLPITPQANDGPF